MPTDRKQLFAPTGSVAVWTDYPTISGWGRWMNITLPSLHCFLPPLPSHPFTSKGQCDTSGLFCCMMEYTQLLHLASFEECCGCTLTPIGWSLERGGISKLRHKGGGKGAERVMSHWAVQEATEPVTWLMADLPLHWRGEPSKATSPCPPHTHTRTPFIDR